ncbi:hypothetical protein K525DRAFT_281361 [Schizophyllum commune Loenen D]|nr:hypothetical protein K525DRAFT_281361 [Schizophyllum commune Loenen D]
MSAVAREFPTQLMAARFASSPFALSNSKTTETLKLVPRDYDFVDCRALVPECLKSLPPEACAGILGCRTRRQECLVEDFDQVLGVIECIYAACEPPEACAGFLGDLWGNSHQVLEVPQDLCPSYRGARQPLDTTPRHFGGIQATFRNPQAAGGMRAVPTARYAILNSGGARGRLRRLKDASETFPDVFVRFSGSLRVFVRPPNRRRHARGPSDEGCGCWEWGRLHARREHALAAAKRRERPRKLKLSAETVPRCRCGCAAECRGLLADARGEGEIMPSRTPALPAPAASDERGNSAALRGYAAGLRPAQTPRNHDGTSPCRLPARARRGEAMPSASTHVPALCSPTLTANPSVQSPRVLAEGTRHVPLDHPPHLAGRREEGKPCRFVSRAHEGMRRVPPCCQPPPPHVPGAAFYLATEPISASSGVYTCEGEGEEVEGEGEEIETSSGSEGVG